MIWTVFCLCLGLGLFGRWESIHAIREAGSGDSVNLSNDEIVFLTLGKNLQRGWAHYNVQEWYQAETEAGRTPPDYLNRPLFKHPPLLPVLLAQVGEPGIQGARNAFMLMMAFGILVSLAVYALARCLLTPMWSLVPAAMAWIDPMLWGGSIKVWLDLPLTFFCVAGLAFAWLGRTRPLAFLGMGICFGFAFLTKYPAIIVWSVATILLAREASVRDRSLFRWGCVIPWLMLLPWLGWNLQVYGGSAFDLEESQHGLKVLLGRGWSIALAVLLATLFIWVKQGEVKTRVGRKEVPPDGRSLFLALFVMALAGLWLCHSWYSGRVEPRAGLSTGFFAGESPLFYINRIITLNPILWPGVVALFWLRLPGPADFLRWTVLAFILVFSVWGNYQSRYIMPVVPLLCVLSAWALFQITDYLSKPEALWLERAWICAWAIFAVLRLDWIHQKLTLPNHFTYF